ncbi:MAG: molybdenum cofactor guanylyltransferase [Chthoniobacteraceae bacterium]
MNLSQPFSAVLMAGGRSERMGADKAALVLDGKPLWKRQLAKLRATGAEEVFISGHKDGPFSGAGVPIVEDLTPGAGPLAGLQAALTHARNQWLLVLAVDLPDVPADFLSSLVGESMDTYVGLVPAHREWLQPLAAVYSRDCLPLVGECLADENLSLRRFFRLASQQGFAGTRQISAAELELFRNLNSPADLEQPPA